MTDDGRPWKDREDPAPAHSSRGSNLATLTRGDVERLGLSPDVDHGATIRGVRVA